MTRIEKFGARATDIIQKVWRWLRKNRVPLALALVFVAGVLLRPVILTIYGDLRVGYTMATDTRYKVAVEVEGSWYGVMVAEVQATDTAVMVYLHADRAFVSSMAAEEVAAWEVGVINAAVEAAVRHYPDKENVLVGWVYATNIPSVTGPCVLLKLLYAIGGPKEDWAAWWEGGGTRELLWEMVFGSSGLYVIDGFMWAFYLSTYLERTSGYPLPWAAECRTCP